MKSKLNTFCTVFFLAAACIFAVPVSVSAFPPSTSATANTTIESINDEDIQQHNDSTPSTAQSSQDNFVTGFYTQNAAASASAEIGRIRLFATGYGSATDTGPPSYVSANAFGYATAIWNDNFTIDGGALNGQDGHLIAGFSVDGSLYSAYDGSVFGPYGAKMSEYFRASLRLHSTGGAGQDVFAKGGQRHTASSSGDIWDAPYGDSSWLRAPGVWPIEIDFIFGTPIQVSSWGDVSADVRAFATDPSYTLPRQAWRR